MAPQLYAQLGYEPPNESGVEASEVTSFVGRGDSVAG